MELNVTPTEVGQFVLSLEECLDVPLFHRATGGRPPLVLTAVALRALPNIREGFDRLNLEFARLKKGLGCGRVDGDR
ncbi:hypothetical protein [Paraburkholderia youngii]|uniref:hypothetical protein n=1 Tax=Paraburkholderia youngii TaxID=2782701 RepID=UPI003D1EC7EF